MRTTLTKEQGQGIVAAINEILDKAEAAGKDVEAILTNGVELTEENVRRMAEYVHESGLLHLPAECPLCNAEYSLSKSTRVYTIDEVMELTAHLWEKPSSKPPVDPEGCLGDR